jgi:cbb3-type cytochrome oxidase maturation protein
MFVILILITLSLMLAVSFLIAFLWAVKSDQYEDTYTPSIRILLDDENAKTGKQTIN